MSFNGSGVFSITTTGQPVVAGTTISDTVFNALTADLASGLSTCMTKDGQQVLTANIPYAGYKNTGMGIGTATTDSASIENVNLLSMCEGRLTLTTGVAVTTEAVNAAETLYYTPYKGNCIALYDGSNWYRRTFSELSIDVPDATNCYDVFAYDNSGTVTLELTAWTNTTTRATALALQEGVLVKSGATTRRYLGTFYSTTAGNGQINDNFQVRGLWNYYNRMPRQFSAGGSSNSWTYTTATVRQADNSATNEVQFVVGVVEDMVQVDIICWAKNSGANVAIAIGACIDATASLFSNSLDTHGGPDYTLVAGVAQRMYSQYRGYPASAGTAQPGFHFISWNEYSAASGTTTWYWQHPTTLAYGGMSGFIMG